MFNAAPLGRSPADKKEGITLYQDLSKNPYAQPFTFEGSRSHGVLVIHGFTLRQALCCLWGRLSPRTATM